MGERPPSTKRPRHSWQNPVPSSAKFALQVGESINHGPRTLLEFFAMEQVLNYCMMQEIPENIATIYNVMVEIVVLYDFVLPIGKKSISEVDKFMREHEYHLDFYRTLCITSFN